MLAVGFKKIDDAFVMDEVPLELPQVRSFASSCMVLLCGRRLGVRFLNGSR